MSASRHARQFSLAEIGTTGQARIEATRVRAGGGDARANEIALAYLERAGMRLAPDGEPIDVAEVDRVAGVPALREAAAFLVGSLAATDAIARAAGAPARPVTHVPSLAE
jgi:hypothetical protein